MKGLKVMGYNPNLPRTVAYTPKETGGIGMNRLQPDQGIRNVCHLLKHIRERLSVGGLFIIAKQWAKLWAGISRGILKDRN